MSQSQPKKRAPRDKPLTFGRLMNTLKKWDEVQANRVVCIVMARDFTAGYVLSRLIYWHSDDKEGRPRLRVQKEGFFWVARTYEEWFNECYLTHDEIVRVYCILEDMGLIETRVFKFNGDPTIHIRIIEDAFMAAWNEAVDNPPPMNSDEWKAERKSAAKTRPTSLPKIRAAKRAEREKAAGVQPEKNLVIGKNRITKTGKTEVGKTEKPKLEKGLNRESLTLDTASVTAPVTSLVKNNEVEQVQHQQQHASRVKNVDAAAEIDSANQEAATPQKAAPKTVRPKTNAKTKSTDPQLALPETAVTPVVAPIDDNTPRTALLARLESLRTQKPLAPRIAELERASGQTWEQLSARLIDSWPETDLTAADLIERANQDYESFGLDEGISLKRATQEVESDAPRFAWSMALWRLRDVKQGTWAMSYKQSSVFLTRLDETLSVPELARLLKPLWAPLRAAQPARAASATDANDAASRDQAHQQYLRTQEIYEQRKRAASAPLSPEAQETARQRRETAREDEAVRILLAELETEERQIWENESLEDAERHVANLVEPQPPADGDPFFAAKMEDYQLAAARVADLNAETQRVQREHLKAMAQLEYGPRFNEIMDDLRDRDDQNDIALAA